MNLDVQLLNDCRRNDRKAQQLLYKSCFNLLMGVCIRYKKDEDEARAILNQGFLKILTHLDKYNPQVPFEAWARRVMINTIIDEFRRNKKERETMQYTDFEENPVSDSMDWNEAEKRFDVAEIEFFIKQLPPMSQKVFNLFVIDGFNHKEIAQMLDISDGTSKWHLAFARKNLQEKLKNAMEAAPVKRFSGF